MPNCEVVKGDRGYDANSIRLQVSKRGAMPNSPPKVNRRWRKCFSPFRHRKRNAIERMFCRFKNFKRIATRYDRSEVNFLATVCLGATARYSL